MLWYRMSNKALVLDACSPHASHAIPLCSLLSCMPQMLWWGVWQGLEAEARQRPTPPRKHKLQQV